MVMGRPNKGVTHVDNCDGSELSKERAKMVLQTITGELSVSEAMEKLGIQRPYFAELRLRALQGAVDALEPGRPGRKPNHEAHTDQQVTEMEAKIAALERELLLQRTRAEVAEILPGRLDDQKGGGLSRQARRKMEREERKRQKRSRS